MFDLVNLANGRPLPEKATTKKVENALPDDHDGLETTKYLENVKRAVSKITGVTSASLGLHPAVYFYGRTGAFQPISFLAAIEFVYALEKANKLKEFTRIRSDFERFLFENKNFVSLTSNRLGSGARSLNRIKELYLRVMCGFIEGKRAEEIKESLFADQDFSHLGVVKLPSPRAGLQNGASGKFSSATKSAVYFRDAIVQAPKCAICNAIIHRNSLTFDHKTRRRDGGTGDMDNAQMAHPYCNTGYKS